jgi:4-hydroxymandelate oxidase
MTDAPVNPDMEAIMELARSYAHTHRMQQLGTESLLAALLHQPTPEVASTLARTGVDIPELQDKLEDFFVDLPGRRTTRISELVETPRLKLVLKLANRIAGERAEALDTGHLLEAISRERSSVGGQILARLSTTRPAAPAARLLSVAEYRELARQKLDPVAWAYYAAGSDAQKLKHRNRRAWEDVELRPRVLVDVSNVDPSTELLSLKLPFPALIAPMAYQRLANNDGELATARAAASAGVPYIASTMSNVTLEEIAQATTAPKWFQLYCHRDRAITEDLIRRAEAAGYRAIVVTVDAPVLGRRLSDERSGFELPKGLTRANLVKYESKVEGQAFDSQPSTLNGGEASHLAEVFRTRQDASLTWQDIDWFRSMTSLPILLKGVVRADDAKRAVESACQGIIVSNHGGRQLDAAVATARALPEVAKAVAGRIPVLVDGAIEWGADILRALALGANAVLIGRPVLWGLAVAGEEGVRRVLALYREDFTRAMQLAGYTAIADITPDLLA